MYVIPVILISVLLILLYFIYRNRKKEAIEREEMEELPLQDKVQEIDFNGHFLYLAPSELDAWKSLSNAQKQRVHMRQRELIRLGVLVKVTDEQGNRGLITKKEAVEKGIKIN